MGEGEGAHRKHSPDDNGEAQEHAKQEAVKLEALFGEHGHSLSRVQGNSG
jgi:hypothetical protein